MSADNLSSIGLPPVAPTTDANPRRESTANNKEKDRANNKGHAHQAHQKARNSHSKGEGKPTSADVGFEHTEHELDDFA